MNRSKTALPETNEVVYRPEVIDKKPGKLFIIISYAIALASLIAMLFVPLFYKDMFIKLLLAAVAPILKLFGVDIPLSAYGEFFMATECSLTNGIMLTLIYVSVVLALIMLIPVIVCKAEKGANLRCAFAAEHIAFIAILAYVSFELFACSLVGGVFDWLDFSLLIPLGVLMLVMTVQSIRQKGGLGVAKFIIFLLSLVTLFTLFDIVTFIPALADPLTELSSTIKAYDLYPSFIAGYQSAITPFASLCNNMFTFDTANIPVLISQIISIALPMLLMVSIFLDTIGLVAGNKNKANGEPNPQKGWFVVAAIRYSLIIVLIAAAAVLSFVLSGFGKVGIYMYLTAVVVLLTFIVEIIRYCVGKSKVKAYRAEQKYLFDNEKLVIKDDTLVDEAAEQQINMFGEEEVEVETVETVETVEVEEKPVQSSDQQLSIMDAQEAEAEVETVETVETVEVEEAVAEPVVVEEAAPVVEETPVEEPVVEAEEIVSEPENKDNSFNLFANDQPETESIDPFIDKLNDEERAQFFDVFINRNKGKFPLIPTYIVNGDNSDFFNSVFVHINRMRNLCSDSLLAKIYNEMNKD